MKRSISNNKKSPVNVNNNENEIDVNVLLNDPKSLHKMLNKKSDDNDYVPTNANPDKLSNRPKNAREGRPYAKKKYSDKREYNKSGELLNKGVRTIQDGVGKGYDKGKELISDFIKDSKKDGVGETLRDRGNSIKHIIDEYVKNNEFLQRQNRGAKKVNKFLGIDKYLNKEKEHE